MYRLVNINQSILQRDRPSFEYFLQPESRCSRFETEIKPMCVIEIKIKLSFTAQINFKVFWWRLNLSKKSKDRLTEKSKNFEYVIGIGFLTGNLRIYLLYFIFCLIEHNIRKTLVVMNLLTSIGVNPTEFDRLISTRFYA